MRPGQSRQSGGRDGCVRLVWVQCCYHRSHPFLCEDRRDHVDGRAGLKGSMFRQSALQRNVDMSIGLGVFRSIIKQAVLPERIETVRSFPGDLRRIELGQRDTPVPALVALLDRPA